MFLNELSEPQLLVVYPGRFQPFHKGHHAVFEWLSGKFGRNNVIIATSNKVEPPRSPFSFAEKAYFMQLTGVPADRIVQATSPYNISNVLSGGQVTVQDPNNTVVVFAISEKDMEDDPRFGPNSFTKKDGSPAYLQKLINIKQTENMTQHAYIMTVPTFDFNVLGQPMRSGTELREMYTNADTKTRQAIIKDLFGVYTPEAEKIMNTHLPSPADAEPVATPALAKTAKLKTVRKPGALGEDAKHLDPARIGLLTKAKRAHPLAHSDEEAMALYIYDKEQRDVDDVEHEEHNLESKIQKLEHLLQQVKADVHDLASNQNVAEGSLEELANTSLKVKEPKDMYNVNDRKQTTYKIFKFKSGKKTFLINFTVKSPPTYGKKSNWNAVIVSFGVKEKQDDYSFGDEMNTDLTGKNKNQFLIYSTVINTIRRFITEYNTEIDEIIMQGAGERQEAMYQRFFQSAGKYFPGWHYDGKYSLVRDVPRPTGKKVREQGMAEGSYDDDDTSMSEKLHDLLQQGMDYKQAVNLVAKTYNTYPEYVVGTYNRWGNHNHDPYDDFGEQGVAEGPLNEGLAHPVIVVDVQPEYSGMNDGDESSVFPQIINFVNKQTGPVLMFVNAEDQGLSGDTIQDIKQYWDDTICPEEERYIHDEETDDYIENSNCPRINWQRFSIADKGYGYFRSWMDHGIEPATIIATIRELYQQKKSDSRELQFPAFNQRTPQQSLIMGAMQEMEDDPISVNWTSVSQLKRFNGAYIVGGARDQCLREVELLMNAFNIKYKRIDSLIYEGQQGVAEGATKIHSDKEPKLTGVSFQQLDSLCESAGSDYVKFDRAIKKNLALPAWTNTLELYGVYARKLNEVKSKTLAEGTQSDIEQQLFDRLTQRALGSMDSASVGDRVSLLHLATLNIPGHKVVAKLNGFLTPKQIVKIVNTGRFQQLEFADGSRYPEKDGGDIFQQAQTWNMTKLFPSADAASKAFMFYMLEGQKLSDVLDFQTNVEQGVAEGWNPEDSGENDLFAAYDKILIDLCNRIVKHQKQNSDRYGLVAAAVVDPDHNVVYGINHKLASGKRVHAERAAMANYIKRHGVIPKNSVVITTLSPCTDDMPDRKGPSCTELLNDSPITRVYAGYRDPSQTHLSHDDFDVVYTQNSKIESVCKQIADRFLKESAYTDPANYRSEGVVEGGGVGVVKGGRDPRYSTATMGDQNAVNSNTLGKEMQAFGLTGRKNPGQANHQKNVSRNISKGIYEQLQAKLEFMLQNYFK